MITVAAETTAREAGARPSQPSAPTPTTVTELAGTAHSLQHCCETIGGERLLWIPAV
jgi:hypothetical protein